MRLNVGCGIYPERGAVNLDMVALPGVDVVWNVDDEPWPFEDELFHAVDAVQVFEHVEKPLVFMREAHRVLRPGGLLRIVSPHWLSENAFTDPTHRRFCTERTWDYWCPGTDLHGQFGAGYAGDAVYEKDNVQLAFGDVHAVLRKRPSARA